MPGKTAEGLEGYHRTSSYNEEFEARHKDKACSKGLDLEKFLGSRYWGALHPAAGRCACRQRGCSWESWRAMCVQNSESSSCWRIYMLLSCVVLLSC